MNIYTEKDGELVPAQVGDRVCLMVSTRGGCTLAAPDAARSPLYAKHVESKRKKGAVL